MTIRVLLADDHAVVRNGLAAILQTQTDFVVVGLAANGREALARVEQHCPQVVVMDIAMPELNGIEAARQMRLSCPQTQIVMLSMHHTPEHIMRALQAGAMGYVLKESASDEVVEAIRAVHRGQRYLSHDISQTLLSYYATQEEGGELPDLLASLSDREREVLQLLVEGRSLDEIAQRTSLATTTVKSYRNRMMLKLGIDSLPDLVRFAIRHGMIPLE